MEVCPTCQSSFETDCSFQRFCSRKCKSTWHNRTKRGLPLQGYISPYHGPIERRFWMKVNKNGPVPDKEKYGEIGCCWEWKGKSNRDHYGTIVQNGKQIYVHRYSYELNTGPIPSGYEICHKCDNPSCVRPEHLWADTHKNNMIDCDKKGRLVNPWSIFTNNNLNRFSDSQLYIAIQNCQLELERRKTTMKTYSSVVL